MMNGFCGDCKHWGNEDMRKFNHFWESCSNDKIQEHIKDGNVLLDCGKMNLLETHKSFGCICWEKYKGIK